MIFPPHVFRSVQLFEKGNALCYLVQYLTVNLTTYLYFNTEKQIEMAGAEEFE